MAPRAYCLIQKIPKAVTMVGTIKGRNVPIQPRSAMITNNATSDPADGSIIVPSSSTNKAFFKGKSNFAKVNPAREQKNSCKTVTVVATNSVFKKLVQKLMLCKTWVTFVNR